MWTNEYWTGAFTYNFKPLSKKKNLLFGKFIFVLLFSVDVSLVLIPFVPIISSTGISVMLPAGDPWLSEHKKARKRSNSINTLHGRHLT